MRWKTRLWYANHAHRVAVTTSLVSLALVIMSGNRIQKRAICYIDANACLGTTERIVTTISTTARKNRAPPEARAPMMGRTSSHASAKKDGVAKPAPTTCSTTARNARVRTAFALTRAMLTNAHVGRVGKGQIALRMSMTVPKNLVRVVTGHAKIWAMLNLLANARRGGADSSVKRTPLITVRWISNHQRRPQLLTISKKKAELVKRCTFSNTRPMTVMLVHLHLVIMLC